MEWIFLSVLAVFLQPIYATINGSYIITVPKTFRPGMPVNMKVLILKEDVADTPVNVSATFFLGIVPLASSAGKFKKGIAGSLKLPIPSTSGLYEDSKLFNQRRLLVTGSGGLTFQSNESRGINFVKKGLSIYVQTDKGIYKPGQTVHIRALGVYPDLKVFMGKMSITITDPKGNKLTYWKDEMSSSGVVTKDFELTSQLNMGDWKISVEILGNKKDTIFEVKEYVLPKFKVDILANKYATLGNPDIQVTVTAKYTYGKVVNGNAKMNVYFGCYRWRHDCKSYSTEFELDGSHSLVIKKKTIVDIYGYSNDPYTSYNRVNMNVTVTDKLTQKMQTEEVSVELRRSNVVLKYSESSPKVFKPNFPFEALIQVMRPDDTPLANTKVKITPRIISSPTSSVLAKTYMADENGHVIFKQTFGKDITWVSLSVEASDEFGERATFYQRLHKFKSVSNTYLKLTANEYEVEAGKEIICSLLATESFSSFNYLVLSRGNTILGDSVVNSPKSKTATLKFLASNVMSPSASVVVYFVRDDGEIVADSVTIKVNGAFENMVSVKFDSDERRPGADVNVSVDASKYSQVNLLAVDQSVLLMKKSNDFSVSQVMEELNEYGGSSGSFPPWWGWRRRRRSFFPWYPSASNSEAIFREADVAVLTDCETFDNTGLYKFATVHLTLESVAKSSGGENLANIEKVRSFFPETWLWQSVDIGPTGKATVSTKAPDTITSWVLSGFAVNNVTGFGVANEKPQLTVFQPFFVSMDLPYSVIRGEQVAIKIIVSNYKNIDMEVTVTLVGSLAWTNIVETNDATNNVGDNVAVVIKVSANSGSTISFPIIPTKLGSIPITVNAQSTTSADAVRRNLLVEPEGVEQEYSYSLLLDFSNLAPDFTKELELALPSNIVEGSAKATVSVIGDIMGSSISGMEKLLRMPYGCGEQNMINFAPSMFIRGYLEAVDQLTPSIKDKSVKFMTVGYQRELMYQHKDGSYSAFGERYGNKRAGSLWLTAFVVKSFSRARKYIYIDPENLQRSLKFILSTQQKDGTFKEFGSVSSYLQGGLKSSNPEALTAYVLVSLLESNSTDSAVVTGRSNALSYLKGKLATIADPYTLAIVTYALQLTHDPAKEIALNKLLKLAVTEDGTMHWTEKKAKKQSDAPWFRPYYRPRSADIEMTSYVLLVYALRGDKQGGLPIARWLAQQRNSLGGYSSTQDTVIGLQALSEFAPLIFSPDVSFTISVGLSSDKAYKKTFKVDKDNLIVLQQGELPSAAGKVIISGNGKGIGVLQIGVTYNVDKAPTDNSFNLAVKVITADKNKVETQSCVTYSGEEDNSGMAIMEIGLPSGFNVDQDDINELVSDENNKIKKIETPGRKAVIYFDQVPKSNQICVNLVSVRSHAVGKAQPIPVVIYDYYKPEKRAVMMYATQEDDDLCGICSDCTGCKDIQQKSTSVADRVISFSQFVSVALAIMMYYLD